MGIFQRLWDLLFDVLCFFFFFGNSMKQGVLLRSGRADAFMALGEGGRPVFRSALQLREALRRRAGNFADHLAIPQSNETGSTLDWYSPVSGQVVPWT
ncbi:hypothetical protein ACMTAU_08905, partial [Alcaligenes pakistanensis]